MKYNTGSRYLSLCTSLYFLQNLNNLHTNQVLKLSRPLDCTVLQCEIKTRYLKLYLLNYIPK